MSIKISDDRKLYICCYPYDDNGKFNLNMLEYHSCSILAKDKQDAFSIWKAINAIKENLIYDDMFSEMMIIDVESAIRKVYINESTVANLKSEHTIQHDQEGSAKSLPSSFLMSADPKILVAMAQANKPAKEIK